MNNPQDWGFRRDNRSRFGDGACQDCNHQLRDHFWWVQEGNHTIMEKGCPACPDEHCKPVIVQREKAPTMSAVNLCDRCNALMLGKAVAVLGASTLFGAVQAHKEICPECMKELMAFLKDAPNREGQVFREPYDPEAKEPDPVVPQLTAGAVSVYCGAVLLDDGPDDSQGDPLAMCLLPPNHKGNHTDGAEAWD